MRFRIFTEPQEGATYDDQLAIARLDEGIMHINVYLEEKHEAKEELRDAIARDDAEAKELAERRISFADERLVEGKWLVRLLYEELLSAQEELQLAEEQVTQMRERAGEKGGASFAQLTAGVEFPWQNWSQSSSEPASPLSSPTSERSNSNKAFSSPESAT